MQDKIKIIFFGDITSSLARKTIKEIIPKWKEQFKPDLFIANAENLAHGKGVTKKTLQEMINAGIEIFTGGNHMWKKEDISEISETTDFKLVCPANDSRTPDKYKYQTIDINGNKLTIISLSGRVFIENETLSNPFIKIDEILKDIPKDHNIIIDLHAEATSEKRAMGFYLDGRVATVVGTHTHIPTADAQILENGTGYITDIGMVGAYKSVLGVDSQIIIDKFITEEQIRHELPKTGKIEVNAVLLEIENNKTINIQHLRKII